MPARDRPQSSSDSEHRYPWLMTYLAIIRATAAVTAVVGLIATAICLIGGVIAIISTAGETHPFGFEAVGIGVGLGLVSVFEYVATIASVEFVRVIIDIEHSVRTLAVRSQNSQTPP